MHSGMREMRLINVDRSGAVTSRAPLVIGIYEKVKS